MKMSRAAVNYDNSYLSWLPVEMIDRILRILMTGWGEPLRLQYVQWRHDVFAPSQLLGIPSFIKSYFVKYSSTAWRGVVFKDLQGYYASP
jgi:hypothetical protein